MGKADREGRRRMLNVRQVGASLSAWRRHCAHAGTIEGTRDRQALRQGTRLAPEPREALRALEGQEVREGPRQAQVSWLQGLRGSMGPATQLSMHGKTTN